MLSEALVRGGRPSLQVRRLLEQPWCWPADRALAEAARAISAPPAPMIPGRALLVTVSDGGDGLWAATPEGGIATADLTDEARQISESAGRIAAAALPLVACADWLAHPPLAVRLVYTSSHTTQPHTLGGASCGLSLCLAEASRLLDVPLPGDLAASVALIGSELAPVAHLARKAALISAVALGVTRLLVARGQEEEARAGLGRANLEVIGVSTLAEAFTLAFGDVTEILRARWSADPEAARRSADALYEMALHNTQRLLDWEVAARSAAVLRACLPDGSPERALVSLAEQIAVRHAGRATRIDWPQQGALRSLRRVGRMWFVAHAVQSAADAGDEGVTEVIARAEQVLAPDPRDWGPEELRVRGAIGRARAAIGDYAGAAEALRETVADWFAVRAAPEASYPLSELLRVLALLGRADAVDAVEEDAVRRVLSHPGTDALSRAFVLLSLGRARVLLGQHEAALSALDSPRVSWALTPEHSRFARVRWRVRALREMGREEWGEELGRLQGSREQSQLAALDRALWAGEPWQALVEALVWDVDVRRLLGRVGGEERGRYVADHYRY